MARNDIQPDLQTVNSYFKRKEFYIPSYQRAYAWQVAQCEQLIEDIEIHKENFDLNIEDNYFFGAILIAQEDGEKHEVTLIDGQQRTTTFMLLLKALLLKISDELGKISEDSIEDAKLKDKLKKLRDKIISMLYNLGDNEFDYIRKEYQLKIQDIKYTNDSISELYAEDMNTILLGEDYDQIKSTVIKIFRRQKDNKYTNFYKNFRYFYNYCKNLTNIQIRDFAEHFIEYCQVISITSYNTDQAINIFNSLNGTGVPLSPIEVIVSKTTATAINRKIFESNWQSIVNKTDNSSLDLNLLMTHYIFVKLAEQQGAVTRNPGIRAFFAKNKHLLNDDLLFTNQLDKILDSVNEFDNTELGQVLNKFNGNLKPFTSSYMFFRKNSEYINYLLRIGAVLELSDFAYANSRFKGFLERINLKYSLTVSVSDDELIKEIKQHIVQNFNREDIEQTLNESGISTPLIYLNEYIYCKNHNLKFDMSGSVDIEHIMPQSGLNRDNIMLDAGFTDRDEFNEYAEKLGNKILLESEINRGIGDAWFRTKQKNTITSHHGYIGSKYQLAKSLVNYPNDTWTKEDIDKATSKAAKRIADFIFE
ncbi:DUF262 domain-containing protein [Marinilactibacillus psychrotolerans]|uniref:DUF262 domain-containing protein n=1 Tax=Marinilactibacillus psychrotolerans TaxID=191770 RepID=UPI003885352B